MALAPFHLEVADALRQSGVHFLFLSVLFGKLFTLKLHHKIVVADAHVH
jgi:hypothetical protein